MSAFAAAMEGSRKSRSAATSTSSSSASSVFFPRNARHCVCFCVSRAKSSVRPKGTPGGNTVLRRTKVARIARRRMSPSNSVWHDNIQRSKKSFIRLLAMPIDRGEEGPLVGINTQVVIDENTVAGFTGFLLQGQGNQVTETTLGHSVLVGKQSVVRGQAELPGTVARVADDGCAQASGIACRYRSREEDSCVRAVARARYLQCYRHIQLTAGLNEGFGFFAPFGLVKVDG